jgi:hypothetical protein
MATGLIGGLHALDCEHWSTDQLTIGAAVGVKGLDEHKQHLGPVTPVQIYHAAPRRKLTLDDYHAWKEHSMGGLLH